MVERPHELNTMLGNAGAVAHTVAPRAAFRVLNMAYHVFPDSAAARGPDDGRQAGQRAGHAGPAVQGHPLVIVSRRAGSARLQTCKRSLGLNPTQPAAPGR